MLVDGSTKSDYVQIKKKLDNLLYHLSRIN